MIRILYILNGSFRNGGTEAVILNYYNHIDHSRFHIDFAIHASEANCINNPVHQQLIASGATLYYITPRNINLLQNRRDLIHLFSSEHYDIVHTHMDSAASIVLSIAKRYGVMVRIAHSHNTMHQISINSPKKLVHFLCLEYFRLTVRTVATNYMACSKAAGLWLFGKKRLSQTIILHNAIEADAYAYSSDIRADIRRRLNIENKLVVGHVGRFSKQKNHAFLIDIFHELHQRIPDSVLLLIGDGELKNDIQNLADQYGLTNNIIFYGTSNRVPSLMQSMDVFLLPSLFEGLALVAVEAQAAGLKVFASENVTSETALIPQLFTALPLSCPPKIWCDVIQKELNGFHRTITTKFIQKAGYDINQSVHILETYYEQLTCAQTT